MKIKAHLQKSIRLPVVFFACGNYSFPTEEHVLRTFQDKMLKRSFGTKRKWQENEKRRIVTNFVNLSLHIIFLEWLCKGQSSY